MIASTFPVFALNGQGSTTPITLQSHPQRRQVPSAAMKRNIAVAVVLPKGYADSTTAYPVVYLLHGAGDDEMTWCTHTSVQEMADTYGFIMVCPSAEISWYFDSPEVETSKFETFTTVELVRFIDANFRTIPRREGRALAGNSMGGHGSMFLAIRHKDIFSAAASMSGGLNLCTSDPQVGVFADNWELKKVLGSIQANPDRWKKASVVTQVDNLAPGELALSIECGSDDFFLSVNREFHNRLITKGIPHHFAEHPGAHNWEYWSGAIRRQMALLDKHFKSVNLYRSGH
jgi:S-formylglutathione hydrolase FrmB